MLTLRFSEDFLNRNLRFGEGRWMDGYKMRFKFERFAHLVLKNIRIRVNSSPLLIGALMFI